MSTRDRLADIDATLQSLRREQVDMQAALGQLVDLGTRPLATVLAEALGLPDPLDDSPEQADDKTQALRDIPSGDGGGTGSTSIIGESLLRLVEIGEQLFLHLRVHDPSSTSVIGTSEDGAPGSASRSGAPSRGCAEGCCGGAR